MMKSNALIEELHGVWLRIILLLLRLRQYEMVFPNPLFSRLSAKLFVASNQKTSQLEIRKSIIENRTCAMPKFRDSRTQR